MTAEMAQAWRGMEAKPMTARAVAISADSPKSLNMGKITGTNSSGTSAMETTASTLPTSTENQRRVRLRSMTRSRPWPSPMALPVITAVAAPRPKQTTRNSRFRLPMTALAASISTEFSV